MKTHATDPDIQTLVRRIEQEELDLQPNFQRGEVWGRAKKQRLIDSILRGWHVPPIHVVEIVGSGREEVLDGQQRLVSIRDFVNDEFAVDGRMAPFEVEISKLDGLKYSGLPEAVRRRFDRFSIRVLRIYEYSPEEPAELFYRLNQPTSLTSAEQRNAFIGPAREQIKRLVQKYESLGLIKEIIGFSNARMAYDDTFARVALTLQWETLARKVTSNDLTIFYREGQEFSPRSFDGLEQSLELLIEATSLAGKGVRYNKATLHSWLIFFFRAVQNFQIHLDVSGWAAFMEAFEAARFIGDPDLLVGKTGKRDSNLLNSLLAIYSDRATSRVADVSSVLLRDVTLWYCFYRWSNAIGFTRVRALDELMSLSKAVETSFEESHNLDDMRLSTYLSDISWAELR